MDLRNYRDPIRYGDCTRTGASNLGHRTRGCVAVTVGNVRDLRFRFESVGDPFAKPSRTLTWMWRSRSKGSCDRLSDEGDRRALSRNVGLVLVESLQTPP